MYHFPNKTNISRPPKEFAYLSNVASRKFSESFPKDFKKGPPLRFNQKFSGSSVSML